MELVKLVEKEIETKSPITTEDINGKIEANIKRYEEYWKKSIDYIYQINPFSYNLLWVIFYDTSVQAGRIQYCFGYLFGLGSRGR